MVAAAAAAAAPVSRLAVAALSLGNFAGQASQNVGFVHWFSALGPRFKDVYFVLLATGLAYMAVFLPCYVGVVLVYRRWFRRRDVAWLPTRGAVLDAALVAAFNAFNGFFVIYTSDGTRTPPLVQQCVFYLQLPFTVALNCVVLGHRPRRYMDRYALTALVFMVVAATLSVVPLASVFAGNTAGRPAGAIISYTAIFTIGIAFGAAYNVAQRRYLDRRAAEAGPRAGAGIQDCEAAPLLAPPLPLVYVRLQLLAMQVTGMTAIYVAFFWSDRLPWIGSATSWAEFASRGRVVLGTTFAPWRWGEHHAAGATALLANGGYIVAFWCALALNAFAPAFTAVSNELVPICAALLFKLVPGLDESGVNMSWAALITMFACGVTALLAWYRFEERTNEAERRAADDAAAAAAAAAEAV